MATHSIFLPGEFHGQRSLVGYSLWGRKESDRTEPLSMSIVPTGIHLFPRMNCSTPGLPVHHQLPEVTQTHVHRVSDAIQP